MITLFERAHMYVVVHNLIMLRTQPNLILRDAGVCFFELKAGQLCRQESGCVVQEQPVLLVQKVGKLKAGTQVLHIVLHLDACKPVFASIRWPQMTMTSGHSEPRHLSFFCNPFELLEDTESHTEKLNLRLGDSADS